MTQQAQAYKYALIAVFFWSTVATVFKITLRHITPLELLFYSSLSSLFILGAILIYQKKWYEAFVYLRSKPFLILILGGIVKRKGKMYQ